MSYKKLSLRPQNQNHWRSFEKDLRSYEHYFLKGSVRCFYGQNKFAYCTKCAFARKKVGCRAVAREALDHIEPSLARQRGS